MGKSKKIMGTALLGATALAGIALTSNESNYQTIIVDQTYDVDNVLTSASFGDYEIDPNSIYLRQRTRKVTYTCQAGYGYWWLGPSYVDTFSNYSDGASYEEIPFRNYIYDAADLLGTGCGSTNWNNGATATETIKDVQLQVDGEWVNLGSSYYDPQSYTLNNPTLVFDDRNITLNSITTAKTYEHGKDFSVTLDFEFDYEQVYSIDYVTVNGIQLDTTKFKYSDDKIIFDWSFSNFKQTEVLVINSFQITGNGITEVMNVNKSINLDINGEVEVDSGALVSSINFDTDEVDYMENYSMNFEVVLENRNFEIDYVSIDGIKYDDLEVTRVNNNIYFSIEFINEKEYGDISHIIEYIHLTNDNEEVDIFHNYELGLKRTLNISNTFVEDIYVTDIYLDKNFIYYGDVVNLIIELSTELDKIDISKINVNGTNYTNFTISGNKITLPIFNNYEYGSKKINVNFIEFSKVIYDDNLGQNRTIYESKTLNTNLSIQINNYIDPSGVYVTEMNLDKKIYFSTENSELTIKISNPNGYDISKLVFQNGLTITNFKVNDDNTEIIFSFSLSTLDGDCTYTLEYIEFTAFNNTQVYNTKTIGLDLNFSVINYYYDYNTDVVGHKFSNEYLFTGDDQEITFSLRGIESLEVQGISINGVYYSKSKFTIVGNELTITIPRYEASGNNYIEVDYIQTYFKGAIKTKEINYKRLIVVYDSEFALYDFILDIEVLNKLYLDDVANLEITFTDFTAKGLEFNSITINGTKYDLNHYSVSVKKNKIYVSVPVTKLGDFEIEVTEFSFTSLNKIGTNNESPYMTKETTYDQYELLKDYYLSENSGEFVTFLTTSFPQFYDGLWAPFRFILAVLPFSPIVYIFVIKKVK